MDLNILSHFDVRILRDGKLRYETSFHNGITVEGKNTILDTIFNAEGQLSWYCGLIDTITIMSEDDTMASHAGWTEFTNVDEAARQIWNPDAAASKSLENPSTAFVTYTIDDATSPTLDGIFVTSGSALSGVAGLLWCSGAFPTAPTVADGEVVEIQYTVTIE